MDPAEVAAFYQGKGYAVREAARVAGSSGQEHRVPLLAEGPLGSLAVFFGDFGGIDGPEMGGARKVARDLGATPVLAADAFSPRDRQTAARLGVVLLDRDALQAGEAPAPPQWPGPQARAAAPPEPEEHPWPASGRVGGRDGPSARAVDVDELLAAPRGPAPAAEGPDAADPDPLWKAPRGPAPPKERAKGPPFGWLGGEAAAQAAAEPPAALAVEYDDVVPAKAAGPREATAFDDASGVPLREMDDERRRRRDRALRRAFWALFAFVLLYLFYLFWT